MQTQSQNKMMHADDANNKDETLLEEYHFAGAGEYMPLTILAKSRDQAEECWRKQRVKVEPSQILSTNE